MSRQVSSQVSIKKASTDSTVEDLSRDNSTKAKKKLDRSTSCQEAIEDPEEISIDQPSFREGIEDPEEISIDPPSC